MAVGKERASAGGLLSLLCRQWDVSYTSIVPWVETIRILRVEGRGTPDAANI